MSNNEFDLAQAALIITQAIFNKQKTVEIKGEIFPIITLGRTGLHSVTAGGYQFIEQNPRKNSKWAKMAREGHQILWVFKRTQVYREVLE